METLERVDKRTADELKAIVREKYSSIADADKGTNEASCCGSTCCSTDVVNIMSESYEKLEGYSPDADLGLGCGLPTQFAKIKKGDVVIDLGSGAGNDCFVARAEAGEDGRVIGIDFTPRMIERARANATKLGFQNVEFRDGDIDNLPVRDNFADVIVSNCVLNLVPDKQKVFSEIYRTLKPGGHFSISDVVLSGKLPDGLAHDAAMYAGCVAGAIPKRDYIGMIMDTGFLKVGIQKESVITIPDDILKEYLDVEEMADYKAGRSSLVSITVYAEKPGRDCCEPGTGCC
jgi:arsenite methyltransferase